MTIETPLLIPSFSSKGFGVTRRRPQDGGEVEVYEVSEIIEAASEFLTDSMLLSAYDIHHGHVSMPLHAVTDISFVDSGGYETSDVQDLSGVFVHAVNPKPWDEEHHERVLAGWPSHVPAVFVSYDRSTLRLPLLEQVERARTLFGQYRNHLHELLIKPETTDQAYVQLPSILAHAAELGGFDLLGVTEKELGNSFLNRMVHIAKIRRALDEAGVATPLHVFGGLDPISVPLYFLAGAEVFDGLTWLRFGYDSGYAVYRHNFAARRIGIDRRDDFIKMKAMQDNLGTLRDLANQARRFLNDGDFSKFGPNEQVLRDAMDLLRTRVGRVS